MIHYEVWGLQTLYFPTLKAEADALRDPITNLSNYMYDQAKERLRDREGWIKADNTSAYMDLYGLYLQAEKGLTDALSKKVTFSG